MAKVPDALSRSGVLNRDNYKLVVLSLCRRFKELGADYNFPHPKHDGETILMLCCKKNFDIIIKYFCIKLKEEIHFDAVNNDGMNALMLAIMYHDVEDEIVKLLAECTSDKAATNNKGKTAKKMAMEFGRTALLDYL